MAAEDPPLVLPVVQCSNSGIIDTIIYPTRTVAGVAGIRIHVVPGRRAVMTPLALIVIKKNARAPGMR